MRCLSISPPSDGIALWDDDVQISYRELHRMVDGISRSLGASANGRVGVMLPRSAYSIAAVLGIVRSGATYVPLDPSQPPFRIEKILGSLSIETLVTHPSLEGFLPPKGPSRLYLNGGELTSAREAPSVGKGRVGQEEDKRPLCILPTSGSTGDPKHIPIFEEGLDNFLDWAIRHYGLSPGDRFISVAPLCFDLSLFDIFASLRVGASLFVPSQRDLMFPQDFMAQLRAREITLLYAVPWFLRQLHQRSDLKVQPPKKLRRVFFAGEVYPWRELAELMESVPHAKFSNWYGPTETNVCTYYDLENAPQSDVPIGRPCPFNEVKLIPSDGEFHEICVRGKNVLGSYIHSPAPHTIIQGEKYYRTGDLAYSDSEGNLFLRGRVDRMVKVRGFRVELDEVEKLLNLHPQVRQALVSAETSKEGVLEIRLRVIPRDSPFHPEAVWQWLLKHFPRKWFSRGIEVLSEVPTLPSGKVDRNAPRVTP